MQQFIVTCHECDPPAEVDAVLIFAHWRNVHDLHFVIREAESGEVLPISGGMEELALESNVERIERELFHRLPWWYKPIGRWKINRLSREISDLRDAQLKDLLEHEGISHDET